MAIIELVRLILHCDGRVSAGTDAPSWEFSAERALLKAHWMLATPEYPHDDNQAISAAGSAGYDPSASGAFIAPATSPTNKIQENVFMCPLVQSLPADYVQT